MNNIKIRNLILSIICFAIGYFIAQPSMMKDPVAVIVGVVLLLGVAFVITYISRKQK